MVSSRRISETDRVGIEKALARDFFHPDTKADTFFEQGTVTNVYEEDHQPVLLVKVYKCLHLDLMCYDNADTVRNKAVLNAGWARLVSDAKANGFKEIVTSANGPALLRFLTKKIEDGGFGFEEINVNGEVSLRRKI
jgi:hypothetical protein